MMTAILSLFFRKKTPLSPREELLQQAHESAVEGTRQFREGNYGTAIQLYNEALAIRLEQCPRYHIDLASLYNNLGVALDAVKRYDEGYRYKQKALAMWKVVVSEEDPRISATYSNIGTSLGYLRRNEEALAYQQLALARRLKVLGDEHPDVATSYNLVGKFFYEMRRYEEALRFSQAGLEIRKKILPPEHPDLRLSEKNVEKCQKLVKMFQPFKNTNPVRASSVG